MILAEVVLLPADKSRSHFSVRSLAAVIRLTRNSDSRRSDKWHFTLTNDIRDKLV
jgi:hypothetical protein